MGILGQPQINKKYAPNELNKNFHFCPQFTTNSNNLSAAKIGSEIMPALNLTAETSLSFLEKGRESFFEFVKFVGSVFFVDLRLSQDPHIPTTDAQFSVNHFLKFATSKIKVANFKIHSLLSHAKSFPLARIDSPKIIFKKLSPERKMNPVSQSPSEIESSSTVSSEASRWSEDETPTISDDEFIVSDSEIAEAEAEESEEDDIELLYESFVNLREENKLFKEELAKQNNLLWEIYEELKENQRAEAKGPGPSEAKRSGVLKS